MCKQPALLDDIPIFLRARSTLAGVSGSPSKRTCPASGRSNPTINRNSVDFPHPLGPISAIVRPASTRRSVGSSAAAAP